MEAWHWRQVAIPTYLTESLIFRYPVGCCVLSAAGVGSEQALIPPQTNIVDRDIRINPNIPDWE